MSFTLILSSSLALVFVFWLALLESSISRLSQVSLRVMLEKDRDLEASLLKDVLSDRTQFLVPLQFAIHALTVVIAVLISKLLLDFGLAYAVLWAIASAVVLMGFVREILPNWLTQEDPERFVRRLLPLWSRTYQFISLFAAPILWVLRFRQARVGEPPRRNGEEASEEEIQAYLDVGEQAGIFEEHQTGLIQSALEFRGTLVREIMTPRSQMVAIAESATIAELAELIAGSKFSRIPVYQDTDDNIVGVVYVRNLVSYLSKEKGSDPITRLLKEVWFVPETKKTTELLQEMQRESQPLAIVVSEYGSVSGLITIEDLVEEIVGEIYDEDEPHEAAPIREEGGAYRVRGAMELSHLENALGIDLGHSDATTISGLVVERLGQVPSRGQKIEVNGIAVEVLDADRKRIKLMRVRPSRPDQTSENKVAS